MTNEQIDAALTAFNEFPCPMNDSIARSWNRDQMKAALEAALRAQAGARPVAWAMTYTSRAPYNFWLTEEECDEAVAHVGGSARKMPLYTHPAAETVQPHVAVVDAGDDGKWAELVPNIGDGLPIGTKLYTAAEAATPELDIKAAAAHLMGWRLPDDFSPDCYIVFDRVKAKFNNCWPVGTNLLTMSQAEEMLRYAFADQITRASALSPT